MYGFADTRVGGAAAEVSGHGRVDIGIGGLVVAVEQGGGGHDLTGLAVSTLWNVVLYPSFLERGELSFLGEAFDGGDLGGSGGADWELAGADGGSVEVDGAGSAEAFAATEFCAEEAEVVA